MHERKNIYNTISFVYNPSLPSIDSDFSYITLQDYDMASPQGGEHSAADLWGHLGISGENTPLFLTFLDKIKDANDLNELGKLFLESNEYREKFLSLQTKDLPILFDLPYIGTYIHDATTRFEKLYQSKKVRHIIHNFS